MWETKCNLLPGIALELGRVGTFKKESLASPVSKSRLIFLFGYSSSVIGIPRKLISFRHSSRTYACNTFSCFQCIINCDLFSNMYVRSFILLVLPRVRLESLEELLFLDKTMCLGLRLFKEVDTLKLLTFPQF